MLLLFESKMILIQAWPMISDAGYFLTTKEQEEDPK